MIASRIFEINDVAYEQHRGGKIAVMWTNSATTAGVIRNFCTLGVARVSKAIQHNPAFAYEYTMMGNTLGIFTNWTRVLSLYNN